MDIDLLEQRRQAHLLLDVLSDEKIAAIRGLLEVMVEPAAGSSTLAFEEEEAAVETPAAKPAKP